MPAWSVGTSPPTTHVPERESEPAQGAGAGEGGGRHGTCTYQIKRLADWSMAVSTMPWAKVRGSLGSLGLPVVATDHRVGSTGFGPFEKPSAPAFSMHVEIRALC